MDASHDTMDIPQIGTDRPALKYLNRHVREYITDKWYDIGLELFDVEDESILNTIKNNNFRDSKDCTTEMLRLWLERKPDASWNQLLQALKAPNIKLETLASKIEGMLNKDLKTVHYEKILDRKRKQNNDDLKTVQHDRKRKRINDDAHKVHFSSHDNVHIAFTKLIAGFQKAINALNDDDFNVIKNACVFLAKEPLQSSLRGASNGKCLFEAFSDNHLFFNWIHLSFLEIIANSYVNDSLVNLIEDYKQVMFTKSLREVWSSLPHISVKDEIDKYYSELKQKLENKNPDNMTVQELLDSEPELTRNIALLIAVVNEKSLLISWLIPTDKVYQAYLSFLTISQQSRKDSYIQFRNWIAYLPECVLQEEQKRIGILPTPTLLIGYYYGLLLRDITSDALIDDLYYNELLTAQEQAVVLSGHSLHHRNHLLLECIRHVDSQAILVFSELVKNGWPQIGTQLVTALAADLHSPSHKESVHVAQKVIFDIKFSYIDPSFLLTVFFQVCDSIVELLASCRVELLVDVCENLMACNNHPIKFFSDYQMKKLKKCDSSSLLLQRLSLFFTWSNHSILRVLADQCSEAVNILDNFDCRVDFFEIIASYPIPCFSLKMIPIDTSTHTLLAIQYGQKLYECTLQYVYDVQSVMIEKCDITQHCLQLLAVRSDPTILYWTIPKCVVDLINTNVPLHSEYLYSRGILEVLVYPDLQLTFGSHVGVGSLAFCDDSVDRKHDHTQEYQRKNELLQKTVEHLKADKIVLEQEVEDLLSAKIAIKESSDDVSKLCKKVADYKLQINQLKAENHKLKEIQDKTKETKGNDEEWEIESHDSPKVIVDPSASSTQESSGIESDQDGSWSEEMKSDEDTESPMSTNVSVSSEASSSREASEKSIYLQFSKPDKEKAQQLLFKSIESKCLELLQDLLQLGVDIDVKNEEKATPLWLAIEENCTLELISLLMTPTLIGTRYKQNLAPIHRAAMKGDHKLMLKMINMIRNKTIPLPEIVQTSDEQRIEQVKSQRDESGHASYEIVNKKNKYGWTALHYAADSGCVSVLQVLVMEKECDVAMTTKLGQTAFHFAARKGHLLCLKLLLAAAECSKSLDSLPLVDKNGWNIACHASAQDNCAVMEWLLDHMTKYGADITSPNKKGSTAILIACEYQKTEMFKFLLEKVGEPTLTKDKKSVLHIAACHDSSDIVELLLSEGFSVDHQDQYGETALHVAYKWGSTRVQQVLYDYGADDTIVNKEGEKPVDLAYKKFKIPKEIARRGKVAIAKFVADLRKGKVKMPRCKLMILGEAGVGKTSLLSLLTGEPFNPNHNETEGVDTDFVCTSNICSITWKKKAMEGDEEYKDVAAKQLAQMLPDHATLKEQFELLVKKYTKQNESTTLPPKPVKSKQTHSGGYYQLPVQQNPSSRLPPVYLPPVPKVPIQPADPRPPPPEPTRLSTTTPRPPSVTASFVPSSAPRQEPKKQRTTPPPVPQQLSHTTPAADPDHMPTDIMCRAVKLKKSKSHNQADLPLKFSSFDFAGQKHYKPMHHCFLTSRAVYVVAFNVRHLLNEQQNKCISELKFWINSIHIYTDDDAKIVLVGTHRGPYPGIHGNKCLDPLTSDQQETICTIMEDNFDKDCYASRVSWYKMDETKETIVAMVENSQRGNDSGADVIRQKLLDLGDQYPGNKDDLPTSYLRLEHKIFEERKQQNLITRKDVVGWAREYGIDDPTVALTFFHDIGTIIDPSKLPTIFVTKDKLSILQDELLLSPQWLADKMKELMLIQRADCKYDPKSVRRLQQEGIVDGNILSILWEKEIKQKMESFPLISTFLQAYGLIIPVGQREPQQYYIPFQLPSKSNKMKKVTADCNCIHVNFGHDDGFLPPFVLHHLMFKMYSDSKQSKECCFLTTEGFIELLHDCQWWIQQDSSDVIEVWIRTDSSVRTILPAMHYLNQSLVATLQELKAVNYTLGPVDKCVSCEEEHLLEYITYNTDHQSSTADHLKCPNCAHPETISITTTAVKSKAYKTTFKSFRDEVKKLNEDVQKHLQKKFKKETKMDDNELTWNDILDEWYKKNKEDPWLQVVSALESYDGSADVNDVVRELKTKKLFMCHHIE